METFDRLIQDISSRYHLGPKGRALVENALDMITEHPGGINGFLQKFRAAGLAEDVASWQDGSDPMPLSGQKVEETLGSGAVSQIATQAGVSPRFARTILGYAIPKIVHALAQRGVLEAADVALQTTSSSLGEVAPPEERYDELIPSGAFEEARGTTPWFPRSSIHDVTSRWGPLIIPGLASVATVGLLGYLILTSPAYVKVSTYHTTVANNAPAQANPSPPAEPAQAQPPANMSKNVPDTGQNTPLRPAHMVLSNQNGLITYSGIVGDDASRTAIMDALKSVFGTDKISGDLAVDDHFGPASWTKDLGATLENFRIAGSQARFDGDKVSVGGTIPDEERGKIITSLKSTLGPNFSIAAMSGSGQAETASASQAPSPSASGKTPASIPEQPALNLPVIYFAANSARITSNSKAILEREAAQIKKMPAGTIVQISGFTDSTGTPAVNMKLSQQRANAVRQVLIDAGVDPVMLKAKGYGIYHSAASENATRTNEGRSTATPAAERRVEFHIAQT